MTTKQVLKMAEADPEVVFDRFCGNEEMLKRYLIKFRDDDMYRTLRLQISANNCSEVEFGAHSMKGISATLGFMKVSDACNALVLAARNGQTEQLKTLFEVVSKEYEHVATILKELD